MPIIPPAPATAASKAFVAAALASSTRRWAAAATAVAPVGVRLDPGRLRAAFLTARRVEVIENSVDVVVSMHTRKFVD
jgi:hypothetical protein